MRHVYGYDNAGQLTRMSKIPLPSGASTVHTYQWDQAGRMTRATVGGAAITYDYNPEGLRVGRSAPGSTKVYSYQGDNLATYQETTTGSSWDYDRYYTIGQGAVGNALERHQVGGGATASQYFQYDERGNVLLVTSASGEVEAGYEPDAYGNLAFATDKNGTPLATRPDIFCTGKDFDDTTGLYYFNARWYDPETGRFLSRARYLPDEEHAYSFCEGNPIVYVDPDGDIGIITGIAGITAGAIAICGLVALIRRLERKKKEKKKNNPPELSEICEYDTRSNLGEFVRDFGDLGPRLITTPPTDPGIGVISNIPSLIKTGCH